MRHIIKNKDYFKKINTEEKAYWLGFLMADGCVYKGSSKNSYRLQINLSEQDAYILENFNNAIGSDYPIANKTIYNKKTNKEYKIVSIKINNTEMCTDLMKLGVVPRKSLIAEMPNINKSLFRHFIRGYFDGDGNISYTVNGHIRFSWNIVGGETILTAFCKILNSKDISCSIYKINHSNAVSLETGSKKSIMKIFKYFYCNSNIFLARKYNLFLIIKNIICPSKQRCLDKNQANCGENLIA